MHPNSCVGSGSGNNALCAIPYTQLADGTLNCQRHFLAGEQGEESFYDRKRDISHNKLGMVQLN
jgi:hypothetical protein